MQNSNPSFAVRFSWECRCGTWGTARTETQAQQAIVAHKEQLKDGCGDANSPALVLRIAVEPASREPASAFRAPAGRVLALTTLRSPAWFPLPGVTQAVLASGSLAADYGPVDQS